MTSFLISTIQKRRQKLRLVFIHIPKTGGSTVSFHLFERCVGRWLHWHELVEDQAREIILYNQFVAGHFDLNRATRLFANAYNRPVFMSVVRHPMQQLISNLNYPHTLRARGEKITADWMNDLLAIDVNSSSELVTLFEKYEWLLSQQHLFLTGNEMSLEVTFSECVVFVYPDLSSAVEFGLDTVRGPIHNPPALELKNPSLKLADQINLCHLHRGNLRELLWTKHRNDALLFSVATQMRAGKSFDEAMSNTKEDDLRMLLTSMAAPHET